MFKRITLPLVAALLAAMIGGLFATSAAVAQDQECEEREVGDFHELKFNDTGKAVITQGDEASLTVCASSSDWVELTTSDVDGGTLELQQAAGIVGEIGAVVKDANITYEITMPTLTHIHTDGLPEVEINGFSGDSLEVVAREASKVNLVDVDYAVLEIDARDAAEVTASGSADQLTVHTDDSANASLFNLEAGSADVESYEVTEVQVRFVDTLDAEAHTLSTIEYMTDGGAVTKDAGPLATIDEVPYEPLGDATPAA